jgi:LmbE family N-acetylglucosaminyl deacetylase
MSKDSLLVGKRVLMFFAHCDDELVCGWPILQNPSIQKSLIIASSDRNNTDRIWCSHRKFVTLDLCKQLNIEATVLDLNSDFYRTSSRNGGLASVERLFLSEVANKNFDYIFTHNPFGEYGHLDHIYISNLLLRSLEEPIIFSDIEMLCDWTSGIPQSGRYRRLYYSNKIDSVKLDQGFYRKVEFFYRTRNVWTWARKPSETVSLYRV